MTFRVVAHVVVSVAGDSLHDTSRPSSCNGGVPATGPHTLAEKVKAKASSKAQTASCGATGDELHCHHRSQKRWPRAPITSSRWAGAGRRHGSPGSGTCLERVFFWQEGWFAGLFWGPQRQLCCFPVFFPEEGLRLMGTDKTSEWRHFLRNTPFLLFTPQVIYEGVFISHRKPKHWTVIQQVANFQSRKQCDGLHWLYWAAGESFWPMWSKKSKRQATPTGWQWSRKPVGGNLLSHSHRAPGPSEWRGHTLYYRPQVS